MTISSLAPWIAIALTLILSILVPLFTQIANNKFQLELKMQEQMDRETNRKIDAYENYFQSVGGCVQYAKSDTISEAGASIQRLYVYFPEDKWEILDLLFDNIKEHNWDKAKIQMKTVSKIIALDMSKLNQNSV